MKKNSFNILLLLAGLTILSCAPTGSDNPDSEPAQLDESLLVGQWFFDYGTNQDDFVNEILTVNADKSIVILRDVPNHPEEYEYYEGNYEIIDDENYGLTFKLNLVVG